VSGDQASQTVHKRKVFYIPGYDPMLPRRYRELYRSEGALQAEISGYSLDIKGLQVATPIPGTLKLTSTGNKPEPKSPSCCGRISCKFQ
jgi:hypothetical protein